MDNAYCAGALLYLKLRRKTAYRGEFMAAFLIAVHVLAAVIWVGGMFFAYLALRPATAGLSLAERVPLWSRALGRFFLWVWLAVIALIVTGYMLIFGVFGGMGAAGVHVHVMQALGWVMFLVFGHLFFVPWRRLRTALAAGSVDEAARHLNQIRWIVALNLTLGLIVVTVAAGGRYGVA